MPPTDASMPYYAFMSWLEEGPGAPTATEARRSSVKLRRISEYLRSETTAPQHSGTAEVRSTEAPSPVGAELAELRLRRSGSGQHPRGTHVNQSLSRL